MKFLPVFLFLFVIACQSPAQQENATTKTKEPIALRLENTAFAGKLKKMPNALIVDVRTPEEYAEGAIEGAVNVNFYDENFEQQLQKLDKKTPTFIYCRSGGRSGKTLQLMHKMGFQEVYELQSGYMSWK